MATWLQLGDCRQANFLRGAAEPAVVGRRWRAGSFCQLLRMVGEVEARCLALALLKNWAVFTVISRFFFWLCFAMLTAKFKQNDAREGKNMQSSAKTHQNDAKLCENKPFSHTEHLFCFKKRSKSAYLCKRAVSGCVSKDVEWSALMHFYQGPCDFLNGFWFKKETGE